MKIKDEPIIFEEDYEKTSAEDGIPLIGEAIFWGEYDTRWNDNGNGKRIRRGQVLDLDSDSYIWCFSGPRGAGKTSYMSYVTEKAAVMYDKRIISNYPIEFKLRCQNGDIKHFKSEPLELAKLLMFDEDYRGCLIVIDEAPQIINRLATMTWKNRLLDLWVQQIRKNRNSLLYAAQNEKWVDNELRWQTDIVARCHDASKRYPDAGYKRGSMVLADLIDKSGQWTGYSYEQRPRIVKRKRIITELIWGTFDTFHQNDVFESLKGVKLNLDKYQIGEKQPEDLGYIQNVIPVLNKAIKKGRMSRHEFYAEVGKLSQKEKTKVGQLLTSAGVKRKGQGNETMFFDKFDEDKFISMVGAK